MKHLRWTALAVVAVVLCAASTAVAHDRKGGGAVVEPVREVAGLTGDELLGEAWFQLLSNPSGTFAGTCYPVGHKNVLAPEPDSDFTASCAVKKGTKLFFFFGSNCSDVEPPPFFGKDEAAQRKCAVEADEFFVAASIAVDGGEPVDIRNERFELLSPQRSVDLPEDNFLGVPAGPAKFVAHGWGALVKKLRPGEHSITVEVTDADGVTTTFTALIEVVRRDHHGDREDDKDHGDRKDDKDHGDREDDKDHGDRDDDKHHGHDDDD